MRRIFPPVGIFKVETSANRLFHSVFTFSQVSSRFAPANQIAGISSRFKDVRTVYNEVYMQTNNDTDAMQLTHGCGEGPPDWRSISVAYFNSTMSLRGIASQFGISDAAIRKHARKHGWQRPSAVGTPALRGVTPLGKAMESQLAGVDSVIERSRRFVAAMIQLDATPAAIAEALGVTEKALNIEFGDEFHFHTARRGR
jgi:hypothetical protein